MRTEYSEKIQLEAKRIDGYVNEGGANCPICGVYDINILFEEGKLHECSSRQATNVEKRRRKRESPNLTTLLAIGLHMTTNDDFEPLAL
jgi:hypothetical protein